MNNYEAIEDSIVRRMTARKSLMDIADVIVLPDSEEDYKTPVKRALVTVVFQGEKADANQSIGVISQHVTLTCSISVQYKTRRTPAGVYAVAEEVKAALQGYQPEGCGCLSLSEFQFGNYQNGVWEYTQTVSCRAMRVQDEEQYLPGEQIVDGEEVFYKPGSTVQLDFTDGN